MSKRPRIRLTVNEGADVFKEASPSTRLKRLAYSAGYGFLSFVLFKSGYIMGGFLTALACVVFIASAATRFGHYR